MKTRFVAMTLTLAAWSGVADAGFDYTQVVESMMESQTDNGLLLLQTLGVDNAATLNYTGFIDTTSGSFSYSLLGGQTYLGQSISMGTVGTYDSTSGIYSWTTTGQYGPLSITGSGSIIWTGDPEGKDAATLTIGTFSTSMTSTEDYDTTDPLLTTSTGMYTLTGSGTSATYSGTDRIGKDAYVVMVQLPPIDKTPPSQLLITGDLPQNGTATGVFEFTQSFPQAPEPPSFVLCGIAGVIGVVVTRVRRNRAA